MTAESLWHDLLDAERLLRQAAEDLARRWREAFFSVAAAAIAADYDARLRAGTLPQQPEDAARWLIAALQSGWRARGTAQGLPAPSPTPPPSAPPAPSPTPPPSAPPAPSPTPPPSAPP
ncbi:MAG: hypothetical protein ACP5N6_07610, partial [Anaerolineae bacterium]